MIAFVLHQSALWGAAGAFIYAAPRFLACVVACREAGERAWLCTAELAVALTIGAIAAAAFVSLVMGISHLKDVNAVAAMIGLLANPTAPKLVNVAAGALGGRLSRLLQSGDKP